MLGRGLRSAWGYGVRGLRGSAVVGEGKATTGIVGLDVEPRFREVLTELYRDTLEELNSIPENVFYRNVIEGVTKYRLKVVTEAATVEEIESEIGAGQVEELIEQAKDELALIPRYAAWRLWEEAPPVPEDDGYEDLYEGLSEFSEADLRRAGAQFGFTNLGEAAPRASKDEIDDHIARLRAADQAEEDQADRA